MPTTISHQPTFLVAWQIYSLTSCAIDLWHISANLLLFSGLTFTIWENSIMSSCYIDLRQRSQKVVLSDKLPYSALSLSVEKYSLKRLILCNEKYNKQQHGTHSLFQKSSFMEGVWKEHLRDFELLTSMLSQLSRKKENDIEMSNSRWREKRL